MPNLDIDYAPIWNPAIVADLVELLLQPDLQWFEVEALTADDFAEWQFIQMLRSLQSQPVIALQSRPAVILGAANFIHYVVLEDARQILMRHLLPYATLLDTRLTPLEQATQLLREGVDVKRFCTWVQRFDTLYQEAARDTLAAWENYSSLLRGSERAAEPADQLLRMTTAAHTDVSTLLLPNARPDLHPVPEEIPPPKSSLWRRLLRKT